MPGGREREAEVVELRDECGHELVLAELALQRVVHAVEQVGELLLLVRPLAERTESERRCAQRAEALAARVGDEDANAPLGLDDLERVTADQGVDVGGAIAQRDGRAFGLGGVQPHDRALGRACHLVDVDGAAAGVQLRARDQVRDHGRDDHGTAPDLLGQVPRGVVPDRAGEDDDQADQADPDDPDRAIDEGGGEERCGDGEAGDLTGAAVDVEDHDDREPGGGQRDAAVLVDRDRLVAVARQCVGHGDQRLDKLTRAGAQGTTPAARTAAAHLTSGPGTS